MDGDFKKLGICLILLILTLLFGQFVFKPSFDKAQKERSDKITDSIIESLNNNTNWVYTTNDVGQKVKRLVIEEKIN